MLGQDALGEMGWRVVGNTTRRQTGARCGFEHGIFVYLRGAALRTEFGFWRQFRVTPDALRCERRATFEAKAGAVRVVVLEGGDEGRLF